MDGNPSLTRCYDFDEYRSALASQWGWPRPLNVETGYKISYFS